MTQEPDSSGRPIRVLIVDDHSMVRTGISTWIESKSDLALAGEAVNGKEAVEKVAQLHPDVVLMDLAMPVMDGIAATQEILRQDPEMKILIVTSFSEMERAAEAIRAGAIGFIMKDTSPQEMIDAISTVAKGRPWLSAELTRYLVQQSPVKPASQKAGRDEEPITERELAVLRLLAQGASDQEIADQLVVSKSTIRYHVNNILAKLHLENRTQAALYAIRGGLVK